MKEINKTNANHKEGTFCGSRRVDLKKLEMRLHEEAAEIVKREPQMKKFLNDVVLEKNSFACMLSTRLARKLAREDMNRSELSQLLEEVIHAHPEIQMQVARDLIAIDERDPACESPLQALLYFKGFHAISTYRISHQLWLAGRKDLALYFQSIGSEVYAVDIHPAARIGCGILLDHATSFVVGETAVIEDDVSILHEVTLGGTGKETGNRHPIVRSGVLIGAGAKILGRVIIGECAKIGAGSVVLSDVPAHKTVAGVPAVIVGEANDAPALAMEQGLI